jgi:hypothetical protein
MIATKHEVTNWYGVVKGAGDQKHGDQRHQ